MARLTYVFLFAALLSVVVVAKADNWALLVAGSNGYWNYRHQADVSHAYQILKKAGFKESNIVTMMFDDVANDPSNPFPGTLINQPNGPNVYKGVVVDYKGNDVTPANFLKILSGEPTGVGSGKIIKSTSSDRVFVNFVDHGAPGLVAFPTGDYLYAHDWIDTLEKMFANKQYSEMVIYVEACESGSMFNGLLKPELNIFATTAADPNESSYACYYDDSRDTYLGDCYSVNWMEDSDRGQAATETLEQQFNIVRAETNESHVCQYGDLKIDSEVLANFMSERNSRFSAEPAAAVKNPDMSNVRAVSPEAVPQYDAEMVYLMRKYQRAAQKQQADAELGAALDRVFTARRRADELFHKIASNAADLNVEINRNVHPFMVRMPKVKSNDVCTDPGRLTRPVLECMKSFHNEITTGSCKFSFDDYSIKYNMVFRDLCNANVSMESFRGLLAKSC